jgi:hypothetical protein
VDFGDGGQISGSRGTEAKVKSIAEAARIATPARCSLTDECPFPFAHLDAAGTTARCVDER